jgi:hypothetical protein
MALILRNTVLRVAALFPMALLLSPASDIGPTGMYCGGNQIVQVEEVVRAASLEGDILDPSGSAIPYATVQIQAHNSPQMIVEKSR